MSTQHSTGKLPKKQSLEHHWGTHGKSKNSSHSDATQSNSNSVNFDSKLPTNSVTSRKKHTVSRHSDSGQTHKKPASKKSKKQENKIAVRKVMKEFTP